MSNMFHFGIFKEFFMKKMTIRFPGAGLFKKKTALILGVVFFLFFSILIGGMFFFSGIRSRPILRQKVSKRFRIGLILNGSHDDRGWSESHYDAIMNAIKDEEIQLEYMENVPVNRYCENKIDELIKDGCRLIILDYEGFERYGRDAAIKNPDVYFLSAFGTGYRENFTSYYGRMYQARYLLGMLAGLQTKTNEIGYVAAFPNSRIIRGIDAFALGVRKVNPDAEVYVRYSDSWSSDELCERAAELLVRDHDIDVMVGHSNSRKPLDVANLHDIWTIGYHMDNKEFYPHTFLSAAVWKWEDFYKSEIRDCRRNFFRGSEIFLGIDEGFLDISPITENVSPEIREIVYSERERLLNREYDIFYGPITDNEGVLRVPANESMTDRDLINNMDWYVPGVNIDE